MVCNKLEEASQDISMIVSLHIASSYDSMPWVLMGSQQASMLAEKVLNLYVKMGLLFQDSSMIEALYERKEYFFWRVLNIHLQ